LIQPDATRRTGITGRRVFRLRGQSGAASPVAATILPTYSRGAHAHQRARLDAT
jgi:hypothetical protein